MRKALEQKETEVFSVAPVASCLKNDFRVLSSRLVKTPPLIGVVY
jgi:hypothetical protein